MLHEMIAIIASTTPNVTEKKAAKQYRIFLLCIVEACARVVMTDSLKWREILEEDGEVDILNSSPS